MALIPLAHAYRLSSPAAAEALYRALGERVVTARGYHTTSEERIAKLVDAVDPRRDNTLSFEGGMLDRPAHEAFVATGAYHYFDLRTRQGTCLRVWPGQYSWVHTTPDLAQQLVAREPKTRLDGDSTLVIAKGNFAGALRAFHAVATPPIDRGFVMKLGAPGREAYKRFLLASRCQVDVVLELDVAVARQLSELFQGESHDWQAGGVLVRFPACTIHGFARNHSLDKERDAWFKRVDRAVSTLK